MSMKLQHKTFRVLEFDRIRRASLAVRKHIEGTIHVQIQGRGLSVEMWEFRGLGVGFCLDLGLLSENWTKWLGQANSSHRTDWSYWAIGRAFRVPPSLTETGARSEFKL